MIHPGPRGTFHLLLVEDNSADIRLLREALQVFQLPYELQVVTDGEAALLFLRQQPPPDLILLDVNMPKKTGHEVLQEVKQDRTRLHIPVIVLSSSASASDVSRAYDLHANYYLQKPHELNEFFNLIHVLEDFWLCRVRLPPNGPCRSPPD